MSSPDLLSLFNGAARFLRERALTSLTDDRELLRVLNDAWANNAQSYMLERGLWHFALRTSKLDADTGFQAGFGFRYRFQKPDDWVRTAMVCVDEYFVTPLTQYRDEAGFLYSIMTPVFFSYVSDDANYGGDYSRWPATFQQAMQAYLATQVVPVLTTAQITIEAADKEFERLLLQAKAIAAQAEGASFFPLGSWARARFGRRYGAGFDRGNRNSFYG
jgi:hypothetical protein